MHEFPTAPHHGRLPYQGQESALQHLQHFIIALSKCKGRQESEAPRAGIHRCTLLSPPAVFHDRPGVGLVFQLLSPHRPGDPPRLIFSP